MLNLLQDPFSEFSHVVNKEIRHGYAKLEVTTNDGELWYIFYDDKDLTDMAEDNDMTVNELIEEDELEEACCIFIDN